MAPRLSLCAIFFATAALGVAGSSIYIVLYLPSTTHAAECTNSYGTGSAAPTGYGVAYNLFSTARERLVAGTDCTSSSATVQVGSGNNAQYVYNKGYYWSGSKWTEYSLTGTSAGSGWLSGKGTGNVQLPQTVTYVVGYVCQQVGGVWKCGCRDTTCSTAYWQLQAVKGPNAPGGGGGSGGGNIGGDVTPGVCVQPPQLSNPVTYTNKCPEDAGGPSNLPSGRDILIELPRDRACRGNLNIQNTGNVHVRGGKLLAPGELKGINIHNIPANKTIFLEGLDVDGNNEVADLVRSYTMAAGTTIVIQNTYLHGSRWSEGPHADCVHTQGGGAGLGKLIAQNVHCHNTANNGFQIPWRDSTHTGERVLIFDKVLITKGPGKTGGLLNFGGTGNFGDSVPPDGVTITDLYVSEKSVSPKPNYSGGGSGDCTSYGTWSDSKIRGRVCIGTPSSGSFAPADKVGLNYQRSAFCTN